MRFVIYSDEKKITKNFIYIIIYFFFFFFLLFDDLICLSYVTIIIPIIIVRSFTFYHLRSQQGQLCEILSGLFTPSFQPTMKIFLDSLGKQVRIFISS